MNNEPVPASLGYRKILAPFDGSPGSTKALRKALMISRAQGAELTVISVDEHLPRYARAVGEIEEEEPLRDAYFARLKGEASAIAAEIGSPTKFETAVGHAAQSILQFAREGGVDLIVIGHSGHSDIWGTLLGSTTDRVVDHATCDVLVVR